MFNSYVGRHRRPTRNPVTAVARPAVVLAAATALSVGVIAPAQAHPGSHTVRSGDTLGQLAASHGVSWRSIYADNRGTIGSNPNLLRVGQVLTIGGSGSGSRPAPASTQSLVSSSSAYGAWDPHVRPAVQEIADRFGISSVGTRPGHSPTQGRAADFMVYADRAKGDATAQHAIANAGRLGVEYVIWQQRIAAPYTGWSWRPMENRGSATANHMDHVHVSFRAGG